MKEKNSLKNKIKEIDNAIMKLDPNDPVDQSRLTDLVSSRNMLQESLKDSRVNPNTLLEVGGKVAISLIVLAVEKNGILTTKIPIPSFITFRK